MTKPNSEQFARVVLWQLAGLQADIAELHARFLQYVAKHDGIPPDEIERKWQERTKGLREKGFFEGFGGGRHRAAFWFHT